MPSEITKVIYIASIVGAVAVSYVALFYVAPWISRFLGGIDVEVGFTLLPPILGVWIGRIIWYAKLAGPRVYDPYSSLNLSDDKKLRGH